MLHNISLQYPVWYLLLCLALGLMFALLVYFKSDTIEGAPKLIKWILGIIRTLVVSGLAFFLLSPLLKSTSQETKEPIVVIAVDQSKSINGEKEESSLEKVRELTKNLAEKFEVRELAFASQVSEDTLDPSEIQSTNLSQTIEYINDNYGDQNIGSIILVSDGIYNEGKHPIYANSQFTTEINAVLLGDTTRIKDVLVKNVYYNNIAYLNDNFQVQSDIQADNLKGKTITVKLQKEQNAGFITVDEKRLKIESNEFFETLDFVSEANSVGVVKYRVMTSVLNEEVLKNNNSKSFYIEVIDARKKILLLANGPHPDLSALKQSMLSFKNYECEIFYADQKNINIKDYNMVVFHNLPSKKYKIGEVLEQVRKAEIPSFFVAGSQIDIEAFNEAQEVITVGGNGSNIEDILAEGAEVFNSFDLSDELITSVEKWPPLKALFGEYTKDVNAQVLYYQKIKKINTKYPLLAFNNGNNGKQGVFVGEGLWRWRIENYLETNDYEKYDELINKSFQYVSVKDDKRKFKTFINKAIFKDNENIVITARLYNDIYEPVNSSDVSLTLTNQDGKEFEFNMSKRNDFYEIDLGRFSEGNYKYAARTIFNGVEMSSQGKFSIEAIQLEDYDQVAKHDVLQALAQKHGGKTYLAEEIESLENDILANNSVKPIIYQSSSTSLLLDQKWLFALLLILLTLEWFLRRYFGKY